MSSISHVGRAAAGVFAGLAALVGQTAAAEPVCLAKGRASAYSIYVGPSPAPCVQTAARELQRVIGIAAGVELPLNTNPTPPMICLGDNPAARQAGFSADGLADDAFRVVAGGTNVYIIGQDSPAGQVGWGGNENRGTLYGAYAFLERVVGVRWLSPNANGEDIPPRESVAFEPFDVTETPDFASRSLGLRDQSERDWAVRLGCGGWRVEHGHSWDDYPPRAVLRAHPEYLALNGSRRAEVPSDDQAPFNPKFCTSNPGLVQAFAEGVIAWFVRNPTLRFASISPSDGAGWCECEACQKLVVKGPSPTWGDFGGWGHSVTPLVLKFYNDVARIVGARFPDRFVCGYVYYDFTCPPPTMPKLEPNLALVLAPLQQYGLTRYKPEYRAEFEQLCEAWGKASRHVGYYGASTWMRVGIGAPLGPSLPLLKHTFTTIKRSGFKSVYYYPLPWDSCGVHNYLAAKLMWNAGADVDALFTEWLERAYGPGAPAMAELYRLLDREMAAFKSAAPRARADYEMTYALASQVYLKHFWSIEGFYKDALSKVRKDAQRVRLEAFGDNLAILQHVFQEAGMLDGAERSIFHRTAAEYRAFLDAKKDSLAVLTMRTAGEQGGITGLFVPGKRSLAVPRLPRGTPPPRIDGDLSDPAWLQAAGAEQGGAVADKFVLIGNRQPAPRATRALVTLDATNVYVSFRCADNEVLAKERERDDDGIFTDDCVELFIGVGAEDPTTYWHLTVNPANARWDALTTAGNPTDRKANLEWESAAAQGEGYWAAEIRIPFKALQVPGAVQGLAGAPVGATWRVNFTREDQPGNVNSSWSPVERGFTENPSEFGRWYFSH